MPRLGSGWLLASFVLYRATIWYLDLPRGCGCLGDPAAWWPWLARHAETLSLSLLLTLGALWLAALRLTLRSANPVRHSPSI